MRRDEIDRIDQCLPECRRTFHYFKDRYALILLSCAVGVERSVAALKRSQFAGLLRKPLVSTLCARLGGGRLTRSALDSVWPIRYQTYRLTLGHWGKAGGAWERWYQTSRPGLNLVLHLNFGAAHNAAFRALLGAKGERAFTCLSHPRAGQGHLTLAWARIDIDSASREALIEEIQSDWVRDAVEYAAWVRREPEKAGACLSRRFGLEVTPQAFLSYVEDVLAPQASFWEEAMLAAAIRMLRDDLCVRRIYYHTFEGGWRLKRMAGLSSQPPRSLYTEFPKRFCFRLTGEPPQLLRDCGHRRLRKTLRRHRLQWFLLRV